MRVLQLLPSTNDDDPIWCTLSSYRLLHPGLEYEAVSYTWGDATDTVIILIGGRRDELRVTRNCCHALRDLRDNHSKRSIWIDAVCIDQQNPQERSAQVGIMRYIFATASKTAIYLGEETTSSKLLLEELVEASKAPVKEGAIRFGLPLPERICTPEIVVAIEDFLTRPWFKRIWVIQEVFFSKTPYLMCGKETASYQYFMQCLFNYRHETLVTKSNLPFALRTDFLPSYENIWYNLWEVLGWTRENIASDPRDRLFALFSLIRGNTKPLDALTDYTRSVEHTFALVAQGLLSAIGLLMLAAIRHPHGRKMASWIPDFSQNSVIPYHFWFMQFYFVTSTLDTKLVSRYSQEMRIRSRCVLT